MTTLYCIVPKELAGVHGVDVSLEAACARKNIRYVRLHPEEITLDDLVNQSFEPGGLLYRIRADKPLVDAKATTIEAMLATLHAAAFTTIYHPRTMVYPRRNLLELMGQMTHGLSIIPTSVVDETWAGMSDNELMRRAERLGGFPIIVKNLGLSHGQGVKRIESVTELRSYLAAVPFTAFKTLARTYLADYRHFRLIVVDNEVVAVIEYHKPDDDFRTNAAEINVSAVDPASLDGRIMELATQGVGIRDSILGGVDILVEQPSGTPYIAEVNIPCYYARAEGPTGIDISSKLLDALRKKQQGAVHG